MTTIFVWQRTKCIAALALTFVLVLPSLANEAVDKAVAAEMQRQSIPGVAVAVIQNGKVIKIKGYGLANVELNVPVTTETAFKIGSISKPMIAIGVMKLVEDGKIKLDDRVSKYFPDAPEAWKDVTIKHLLSHTSGIMREAPAFDPFKVQADYDVIKSAFTEPLVFQPGEKYQYCNVGYFSLAEIISRVSGKPWAQYLDEILFRPNKMTATRVTSNTEIIANRGSGYAFRGKLSNEESFRALRPSGAFYSSIADMVSWALTFESGITIKKDTIRSMWRPVRLKDGKNAPYGFGWAVGNLRGKNVVGHGGSLSGFRSDLTIFEDDKLTVIVLTNLSNGEPAAISMAVADVFIDFPEAAPSVQ